MLADAAESGCLPRWPYANGQSMTMVGDPSDAIIASAAAFGATGFDPETALDAMVRGANQPCSSPSGDYLERQGLDQYLRLGYLPYDIDVKKRNANSIFGSPRASGALRRPTLEYVTDDFSIAQFAARSRMTSRAYRAFMRRSGWWRRLFNRHSHKIEPRLSSGAFLRHYDNLRRRGLRRGQLLQYSWMVPHDPAGLFRALGNRTAATRTLDRFLRRINGSVGATHTSHALLGNEPNLNVPWLYDWTRRPFKTQAAVRRALLRLYGPPRRAIPGNDDLGELSSWYVFGALGLYPEVPGVGLLAIGSPLFRHATVRLQGGGAGCGSTPPAPPPRRPTSPACASTGIHTAAHGPPGARWRGAPGSATGSPPGPTASGATAAPRCQPPSGRAIQPPGTPARPEPRRRF